MVNSLSSSMTPCGVVILAAGLGKRMCSSLPKVLHEIGGKPLLFHVLSQLQQVVPQASIGVVVGHGKELVKAWLQQEKTFARMNIQFIEQPEQKGTGHAARCAMDSAWGESLVRAKLPVLVLPGDLPLIPSALIQKMILPLKKTEALRLLTCELPDPTGYGRVVRKGKRGLVLRIVEEKDATLKEKMIREVSASIYLFKSDFLQKMLHRISNQNAQGEYYLTDLVGDAYRARKQINVLLWNRSEDLRGVNDLWELAQANQILNERNIKNWALKGVRFLDPSTTHLAVTVQLEGGVEIHPGVILAGDTRIEKGVRIGPRVVLKDMIVGENAVIKTGTVGENSKINAYAQVGPYAHLRPESEVGEHSKIGNFVELKKTRIGEHSSVAHLSYLGDAQVGRNVNIGCGFITCNFDGRVIDGERKHRTTIEDDAFIGSGCQAIAPVKIGKGAYVASGSPITEDVESGALAIARTRQMNKPGYAKKIRQEE
jgi:bifunctional UDP-N-acetylglucosamine pyrophosphorylase / glucosamine-1-phosphate N-acetyltransferase